MSLSQSLLGTHCISVLRLLCVKICSHKEDTEALWRLFFFSVERAKFVLFDIWFDDNCLLTLRKKILQKKEKKKRHGLTQIRKDGYQGDLTLTTTTTTTQPRHGGDGCELGVHSWRKVRICIHPCWPSCQQDRNIRSSSTFLHGGVAWVSVVVGVPPFVLTATTTTTTQ